MEQISLKAQARAEMGKGPVGRLRAAGKVPAIIYGAGIKGGISVTLDGKELDKVLHTGAGGNVLVNLDLAGDKVRTVMFRDIERHPLKGSIQHVDMMEIQLDHKVVVEVPVHLTGKAAGVAMGGIIQHEHRRVKIECLPTQIPDSIDIDITPLNIGQSFHASDLKLPVGVRVMEDAEMTIVSVVSPTAEVAPKTAEEVQAELQKSFAEKEEEK